MEDNLIKKIPPHNTEAEQSVLGSMLLDADAILNVSPILTGEDFYEARYGILYDAMVELHMSRKPDDQVTLAEKLKEKNAPAEICEGDFFERSGRFGPHIIQRRLLRQDRGGKSGAQTPDQDQ